MPTALGTVASHRSVTSTGPIPTTGLQGWWDADDASTFSYSSGTVVSQWRDKSGANRHANSPGGAAPTVVPGSMNARPTLYITGTACRLEIAPFAAAFTTAELFAVLQIKTLAPSGSRSQMLAQWGTNTEVGWYPFTSTTVYENWGIAERPNVGGVDPATLLAPHIYNIRVAPGSLTAVINGATIGTPAATVAFSSSGPYTLGNAFANEPPDGYIGEIVMYNRVLSTPERQQVEQYLTTKWITPATAPIPTTGLQAWYDADDAATFTYSSGTVVSQWRDKSGNARIATPAGTAPLRNGTMNGRPTVTFNGTQGLGVPSWAMTKPVTMITVARGATFSAQNNTVKCFPDGRIYRDGADRIAIYQGGYLGTTPTVNWGTTARLVTAIFNGGASKLAVDGSAYTTGDAGPTQFTTGGTTGIGGPTDSPTWSGDIAEILIYERELSTVERQQVEQYLKDKWTPFNPLTAAPWHAAYWASDPAWTPPANGAAVTTWRDGSGNGRTMTTAGGTPTFRSSATSLNSKPAVEFDGVDDWMATAVFGASVTVPQTFVAVLTATRTTGDNMFASGATPSTWDVDPGIIGGNWTIRAANAFPGGPAADTSKHLVVMVSIGVNLGTVSVDGVLTTGGGGMQPEVVSGPWRLGQGRFGGLGAYTIAFIGFKAGMLTTQEEADLLAWSRSFYGTP